VWSRSVSWCLAEVWGNKRHSIGSWGIGVAMNLSSREHCWGPKGRNSRPKAESREGFLRRGQRHVHQLESGGALGSDGTPTANAFLDARRAKTSLWHFCSVTVGFLGAIAPSAPSPWLRLWREGLYIFTWCLHAIPSFKLCSYSLLGVGGQTATQLPFVYRICLRLCGWILEHLWCLAHE